MSQLQKTVRKSWRNFRARSIIVGRRGLELGCIAAFYASDVLRFSFVLLGHVASFAENALYAVELRLADREKEFRVARLGNDTYIADEPGTTLRIAPENSVAGAPVGMP